MISNDDHKEFSSGSESNSQINEQTLAQIQQLKSAFAQMDKDFDSKLTPTEVITFLDSRMKSGPFDRNIATKIFNNIDSENKGEITVSEFIRNYIFFQGDLKKTNTKLQKKYEEELKKNEELAKSCMLNQNENITSEGLSEKSKITIEFNEINLLSNLEQYHILVIETSYKKEVKRHSIDLTNGKIIKLEDIKVEFKPTSLKDEFTFTLFGIKPDNEIETTIGKVNFPLVQIEKQESYEIEIDIPDFNEPTNTIAKIKASLYFYWSDFLYYSQEKKNSDELLQKIQQNLKKTNQYLQMLNEPLENQPINQKSNFEKINNEININYEQGNKNSQDFNTNQNKNTDKEDNRQIDENEVVDSSPASPALAQLETLIKSSFKQPHVKWPVIIKVTSLIISILGLTNLFYRGDFPNTLGGLCILWIMYNYYKPKQSSAETNSTIRNMLYIVIGLLIYDLIWFFLEISNCFSGIDKYKGGKEDSIFRFSIIITFCNILVKVILLLSAMIQKSKIENLSKNQASEQQ